MVEPVTLWQLGMLFSFGLASAGFVIRYVALSPPWPWWAAWQIALYPILWRVLALVVAWLFVFGTLVRARSLLASYGYVRRTMACTVLTAAGSNAYAPYPLLRLRLASDRRDCALLTAHPALIRQVCWSLGAIWNNNFRDVRRIALNLDAAMSSAQTAGYITTEFNSAITVFNRATQVAQASHRRFVLALLACSIVLLIVRRRVAPDH